MHIFLFLTACIVIVILVDLHSFYMMNKMFVQYQECELLCLRNISNGHRL